MNLIHAGKVLCVVALAFGAAGAAEPKSTAPAEVLARRPHNLAILPDKWIETRPIQLTISFALKLAPNSAEADAFMKTLRTTLKALPQKMDFKIYRQLTPNRFHYTLVMTFPNWAEYRAHETDPNFLKYYLEHWKPVAGESEERLTILDEETGR